MVTIVGTESTLEDLLRDLIQLEHDAKDAYQAAIDRILCAYVFQNNRLMMLSGSARSTTPRPTAASSAATTPTRSCRT